MAWTEITRPKYLRDGLRYASDTTDEDWAVIAQHTPPEPRRGRPRRTALREVVNAIFYIAQSCCQWRRLPKSFPPFTTVQHYFYQWRVVMDNLRVHKVAGVKEAIEAAGAELRYLPQYSPDLNPIEMSFSKLKAYLRTAAERTQRSLRRRIGSFVPRLGAVECANYFAHAGYVPI